MFDWLLEFAPDGDESVLVDGIAALERLKAAAAARQARLAAALDQARRKAEADAGVPAAKRGRGIAAEVALARRDSPARGGRHLGFAKALVCEMPHTLAALENGALSEWRATLLVRESACLDVDDRRRLDAELCSDRSGLDGLGDAALVAAAKSIAYRLDPHAVVDRASNAPNDRTVTIRPAPDTMTYLTALLSTRRIGQFRERTGFVRTVQLQQGIARMVGQRRSGRKWHSHSDIRHSHRIASPFDGASGARSSHQTDRRGRSLAQ